MARTVLKNIYLFLMALNTDKNVKLYYSIKEVAEMFDVRVRCPIKEEYEVNPTPQNRDAPRIGIAHFRKSRASSRFL